MRILKVVTVALMVAGSTVAFSGAASAAGISPTTAQVHGPQVIPTCNHPRCVKPTPAPVGPFVVKVKLPGHGDPRK